MKDRREREIRTAVGAGRWFPADGEELAGMLESYISGAEAAGAGGRIVSAISPHAGFVYSGKVAAHTFRAIKDSTQQNKKPDTVVIIGFSHRERFRGVALMDGDAVRTPLGDVRIDREANRILAGTGDLIAENYGPHNGEHSAENQIPFVQAALPGVSIVVAMMGDHDMNTVDEFVGALKKLSEKKRLLLVASTDLLHDPDYDKVTRTDKATLELISGLKVEELADSWSTSNQVCCGIMPVITAMRFAKEMGCRKGTVLHYRNSGDDFPESRGEWVVGYGAVVFAD